MPHCATFFDVSFRKGNSAHMPCIIDLQEENVLFGPDALPISLLVSYLC